MSLSAFLNPVIKENEKFVVSNRFVGEDGNPEKWEIRPITAEEDEVLRRGCVKVVPIPGKKGQFTKETDYTQYLSSLVVACTVYPNLNDSALQSHYQVLGADNVLKKMLTAGEYAEYVRKVQEVNSYDESMDELVDTAKN